MDKLKILVSAYACEPELGSEQGVGWNYVREISRLHHVWVLTRARNARTIEPYLKQYPIENVTWIYFELPKWTPFSRRVDRLEFIYYYLWQIAVLFVGRQWHKRVQFDIVHHVTFVTYWMPSFLCLLPVPFVWGPVGGGEAIPRAFHSTLKRRAVIYEYFRLAIQRVSEWDPFVRLTARKARTIIVTSAETGKRIVQLAKTSTIVASQVGIADLEFWQLSQTQQKHSRPFRILSAGVFHHRKGYHLSLQAFALFLKSRSDCEYWLFGDGPERESLIALSDELEIDTKIRFVGRVPRKVFLENLVHGDVFLHPSLHESGGFVIAEALAAGRPVICLDHGGPALQVNINNGFKIIPKSPEYVIHEIVAALMKLYDDEMLRGNMYSDAIEGIKAVYLWSKKCVMIDSIYQQIHQSRPIQRSIL